MTDNLDKPRNPADRWDATYTRRLQEGDLALAGEPAEILEAHEQLIPSSGTAVDVACGLGRHARWLAERGLLTTATDMSSVALAAVAEAAVRAGLSITTQLRDVESSALGDQRFGVIVITYFLDRTLLARLDAHLDPGGVALFAQPTVTNLTRNAGPSERFCLRDDEVAELGERCTRQGLRVITANQAWRANGAHEGWLVVTRPGDGEAPEPPATENRS